MLKFGASTYELCYLVAKSCLTLCDHLDCITPGFPVLYHLPEFAQTHVHWVSDAISSSFTHFSSYPQSLPASGSFPVSQLFPSGGQRIGASVLASVFPMNIQSWFPLGWTGWISLMPKDSQEPSPAPQFKNINSSVLSLLYGPTLTSTHDYWKKTRLWLHGPLSTKVIWILGEHNSVHSKEENKNITWVHLGMYRQAGCLPFWHSSFRSTTR